MNLVISVNIGCIHCFAIVRLIKGSITEVGAANYTSFAAGRGTTKSLMAKKGEHSSLRREKDYPQLRRKMGHHLEHLETV